MVTIYSTTDGLENPAWIDNRIVFTQYAGLGYDGRLNVRLISIDESGGDLKIERSFSNGVVGVSPGRGNDELFFYRDDGLFRFYEIRFDASLPTPMLAGDGYTSGWSSITSVDLDGDGQDEMFFYRDDGLYRFYNIKADGTLGVALSGGTDFETSWDSIAAIDIDGDRRDELFFYRTTGEFAYYDVGVDGQLGNLILGGPNYTAGWSNITSVDIRPG